MRRILPPGFRRSDALGIAWIVLIPLAVLGPGLFTHPTAMVNPLTGDQAVEIQPWIRLAWTEVHQGHLPLWNPYSVLGMPLAFNWQSGAFGLPALVGYLVPNGSAPIAGALTTIVVGGSGVFVLGRVLGLGALGCAAGATFYELSGPFFGWVGWPVASVMSWAGWILAATVLLLQGRRRRTSFILLVVAVTFAVYAGQPDTLVLLAVGFFVFVIALLIQRSRLLEERRLVLRRSVDVVLGGAISAALSAPLWLPGLQVASKSIRGIKSAATALSPHFYTSILVPRFDGLPIVGSSWLGGVNYLDGMGVPYVGIIAIVLVALGVARQHRRPEVRAVGLLTVVGLFFTFLPPFVWLAKQVLGSVQWTRASILFAFGLAVLVAVGTDELVRDSKLQKTLGRLAVAFGLGTGLLIVLWLGTTGNLSGLAKSIRSGSFLWPIVTTAAAGVGVTLVLLRVRRLRADAGGLRVAPGVAAATVLLLCQTGLLIAAAMPLWVVAPPESAEPQLAVARTVGASPLGFGANLCFPASLGITQDMNLDYRVQELDVYDPMTPMAYYTSYRELTGSSGGLVGSARTNVSFFCPTIDTLALAKRYGTSYVVEPQGQPGFAGAVRVRAVPTGVIYRVPGAAPATLVPAPAGKMLPSADSAGSVVPVVHPNPAAWTIRTRSAAAEVLRLRLTNLPGWHATIDGRPLKLVGFSTVMLQARIPPGPHVIELRYWPTAFSAGLGLAALGLLALLVTVAAFSRKPS